MASVSVERDPDDRSGRTVVVDGGPTPMGLESTIVACLDGAGVLKRLALALLAEDLPDHAASARTARACSTSRWPRLPPQSALHAAIAMTPFLVG